MFSCQKIVRFFLLRLQVRSLTREQMVQCLKKGFLIVVVARDAAVTAKSTDVYGDLKYAFRKIGMIEGMPFPPKETQNRPKPKKG